MVSVINRTLFKSSTTKSLSSLIQRGSGRYFGEELQQVPYYDFLDIPTEASDPKHVEAVLDKFMPYMLNKSEHFLGYQANEDLPPIDPIAKVLEVHMNNAGDPFIDSYCKTSCKSIERALLRYCAILWNDEPRIEEDPNHPDNFWGYVLNMGSTEGNLNALWNAREYMVRSVNNNKPIVLTSEDRHYSVDKSCDVLLLEKEIIKSDIYGRVNIELLHQSVEKYAKQNRPIIVVYNMGTTFKGAYDNTEKSVSMVEEITKNYNVPYWCHLDGALGGFIIPFLRRGLLNNQIEKETDKFLPEFGFNLNIQSCNASFYKWYGAPYPTGIFMTQNKYLRDADVPDVIGSPDTTLGGGRNAFSALYMWWRLHLTDYNKEIESVKNCLNNAKYLYSELKNIDIELGDDTIINPQRSPYSMSVTFNSPSAEISNKYSIPQETLNGINRSHIYSMKHVKKDMVDEFLNEFRKELKQTK